MPSDAFRLWRWQEGDREINCKISQINRKRALSRTLGCLVMGGIARDWGFGESPGDKVCSEVLDMLVQTCLSGRASGNDYVCSSGRRFWRHWVMNCFTTYLSKCFSREHSNAAVASGNPSNGTSFRRTRFVISTSASRKAWYKEELASTMDIKGRSSGRATW